MALNLDRYNERIKSWATDALQGLENTGRGMNIVHREDSPSKGESLAKLKARFHTADGGIDRVGIKLNRSLVWTHKGAGKGRGGSIGSTWLNEKGERKKTNPKSRGKLGTGGRVAKPWFNTFMEGQQGVDELATIVAVETGDSIINQMAIK